MLCTFNWDVTQLKSHSTSALENCISNPHPQLKLYDIICNETILKVSISKMVIQWFSIYVVSYLGRDRREFASGWYPGRGVAGCLNIKTCLFWYGDFHDRDKTVVCGLCWGWVEKIKTVTFFRLLLIYCLRYKDEVLYYIIHFDHLPKF